MLKVLYYLEGQSSSYIQRLCSSLEIYLILWDIFFHPLLARSNKKFILQGSGFWAKTLFGPKNDTSCWKTPNGLISHVLLYSVILITKTWIHCNININKRKRKQTWIRCNIKRNEFVVILTNNKYEFVIILTKYEFVVILTKVWIRCNINKT